MTLDSSDDSPGLLQRAFILVFVGAILEPLGMFAYLLASAPTALEDLMAGEPGAGEVLSFLLASPDRVLVAVALALVAVLFAWKADTGGGTHHHGAGGGF